jgi:glycerol uptake facilitator-like aquaporin
LAPLIIGLCVFGLTLMGGSISRSCFNPARVFVPAVYSGKFERQWLFWLGELLGGAAAVHRSPLFLPSSLACSSFFAHSLCSLMFPSHLRPA